jgi:hypothetical protein
VAIAEKSRVNEFAEIDGTAAALLGLLELVEVGVPLLPHAATTRAALPATAVRPTLLVTGYNETTSLVGGRVKTWTAAMAACEWVTTAETRLPE